MGEAIGWIILIIIVIALLVGIISLAFKVLIASMAALLAGAAAGYLVLIVADWMQIRKLKDPATLASVVSFRLPASGLNLEFADAKAQQWATSTNLNWLASLASGAMGAWALYLGLTETPQVNAAIGDLGPVVRFFAWMTPVLLMFVFAKGAGMNRSRTDRLRARVGSLATQLRSRLISVDQLAETESSIRAIAEHLNIGWPDEYRAALERYIEANGTALVIDPSPADDFLRALIILSGMDRERLEQVTREWNAIWTRYEKLAEVLRYVDRPAIALTLDDLARGLPALKVLLTQRRWDEFAAQLRDTEVMLTLLEKNKSGREPDSTETPLPAMVTDPYETLNVRRDASYDEIHRKWLRLHVKLKEDVNNATASTERQEIERSFYAINEAWNLIQNEKKCKEGEHLWVDNSKDGGPTYCKTCKIQRQAVD